MLVYNGEVYNYKALKKELESAGEQFTTDGDTEVIFAGLMRHGAEYFAKLDGMFAIAFYDKRAKKLFLARDRRGMKPLYFTHHDGALVFSSEIRGLLAHGMRPLLDMESAKLFFLTTIWHRRPDRQECWRCMPTCGCTRWPRSKR